MMDIEPTVATARIPICWAYNIEGHRCMQPAGHIGEKHAFVIEWTDEECFSPIIHQLPNPSTTDIPSDPATSTESAATRPKPCFVCKHPSSSHNGEMGTCTAGASDVETGARVEGMCDCSGYLS